MVWIPPEGYRDGVREGRLAALREAKAIIEKRITSGPTDALATGANLARRCDIYDIDALIAKEEEE